MAARRRSDSKVIKTVRRSEISIFFLFKLAATKYNLLKNSMMQSLWGAGYFNISLKYICLSRFFFKLKVFSSRFYKGVTRSGFLIFRHVDESFVAGFPFKIIVSEFHCCVMCNCHI